MCCHHELGHYGCALRSSWVYATEGRPAAQVRLPGVKGETMADPLEEAKRAAEAGAADDKFSRLVEALGGTASAQAVFGAPVEKDGVTIVPVARVRYGVGGGGGRGAGRRRRGAEDAEQVGHGQGGGLQAAPVGYIEIRDGQTSYKRIADPVRPLALVLLFPIVGVLAFAIVTLINAKVAGSAPGELPS
jgi:uncharacterized spore protein YtfJ